MHTFMNKTQWGTYIIENTWTLFIVIKKTYISLI